MPGRLFPILLITMATACGRVGGSGDGGTRPAAGASVAEQSPAPADMHSSRISLDWDGTYRGTLPCADCAGIATTITLLNDGSFTRARTYLGEDGRPRMDRGTFVWDDAGTTITLTAEDGATSLFQVGENLLFHLDRDGNRITGDLADRYQLVKNPTDPRIENRRWVLTEVRGEPVRTAVSGRAAFLTLDSEQSRFNGNDSCNAFFGTYELQTGNRIAFMEPIGSTMMACPESAVGTSLLQILPQIDNYASQDDVLSLNKARMAPLARFRLAADGGPQG